MTVWGYTEFLPELANQQQASPRLHIPWRSGNVLYFPSSSMRKQPTFGDATTGFPTKWRLRNKPRNSILMTRHYPDLDSASDWLCRMGNLIQPIRSTTQIWVVSRNQYGISALVSQTSFGGETSGDVAKCQLFSRATLVGKCPRAARRRSSYSEAKGCCSLEHSLYRITCTTQTDLSWMLSV